MSKGQIKYKLNKDTVKKLEEIFALDGSVREACSFANITTSCYYLWIKEFPEMKERFDSLRQKPFLKARRAVVGELETNAKFSLKYLERKRSDEFSLKQKIEHEGEVKIVKNDKELDTMADKVEEKLKDKKTNEEN